MPWIFNYGSNTPKQVAERVGASSIKRFPAYLPGYGRVFRGMSRNWGGGTASVKRDSERTVYGYVVYLTNAEMHKLDRKEGVLMRDPNYERKYFQVYVLKDGETIPTRVQAYVSRRRQFNPPTIPYLRNIVSMLNTFWKSSSGKKVKIDDIPSV